MGLSTLQIIFSVLCTLCVPLKSQAPDDKYIITSGQYSKDIYLYKGDVTSLSKTPGTPLKLTLPWKSWILNIEMDVANDTIFILDLETFCVFNISRFTSSAVSLKLMQCGISKSFGSAIAYDWVTRNMYWSDGIFQWIALRPTYTTHRQVYRILIHEVTDIAALAVDPINRYIFWFDNSPSGGRIERASLAGQQRKAIVTNGLRFVCDIVADVTSKRIFWVDYFRYSIESANYEGFQRQLLFKSLGYTFRALAVDEENVCATVPRYEFWRCVHKSSGEYKYYKDVEPRIPYGIAIFNKAVQPQDKSNFCASASCQHLCVNGDDRGICICMEGYTLNQDGKTCLATHGTFGKGMLVSYKKQICILDFRSIVDGNVLDFNCIHTGLQGVEYLAVNAAEHVVFYYDSTNKRIKSYDLRGRISKTIQGSTGGIVSGLSFDWNQKKLYWCESNTGIIGRVSLRNDITEVFFDSNKEVNDVSVDPHNRTVFWIEGKTSIFSSKMDDGKNRNMLAEGGTKSGLFFDIKSSRLFWIQGNGIVSIQEDGSNIKNHKSASQSNQLIIFNSYFVWISGDRTLETLPTTSVHSIKTTITLPDHGTITGIAVFDENSQPTEKGACDVNNGGCDHICIAVINGRICKCEFGFTLDSDGTTCETVPLNQDFLLATDLTHSRIYQVSLQNGNIRTLDLPLVERPVTVRYDSANKYLYWTEANSGTIMRASKDGKDLSTVYSSVFGTYPDRIELDQNSGYLYFITSDSDSSNKGYIGVINTRNLYSKTLLTGIRFTYGFAIYPSKGILFFTNNDGNSSHIYRSPIDGSFKARVYTTKSSLYDLTIDYKEIPRLPFALSEPLQFPKTNLSFPLIFLVILNANGTFVADRLYWSEYNQLRSSDLSGSNREGIVTTRQAIRCILLAYPYIYYHSDENQKITKLDVTKKQPVNWMSDTPEIGLLISLDIYPKAAMPGNPLCAKRNGMCSTFCLPREKSKTCKCQEGVSLLSDGRTCQGVTKCSEQVKFGSLEDTCRSYSGETCSFACKSDYISKVQPQTVTCQENGTWNHDLTDLCSAKLSTDTPTTNSAALAGGAVAGVVVIAIAVVGIIMLLRRKKPARSDNNAGRAQVFYSPQSGTLPSVEKLSPPSYTESQRTKQQLSPHCNTTGNSYTAIPSNAHSSRMEENYYEEVAASAVVISTHNMRSPVPAQGAENAYLELGSGCDYTSLMLQKRKK